MDNLSLLALQEVGLTLNEAKVYLSLLNIGSSYVPELSRIIDIHRINLYDILVRLEKKGLVTSQIKDSKKVYFPTDPKIINDLLKEKQELLNKVMPNLSLLFNEKKETYNESIFTGIKGLMYAYNLIITLKQNLYVIGNLNLIEKYLKHRFISYNNNLVDNEIRQHLILPKQLKGLYQNNDLIKIRLSDIPYNNAVIKLCGDYLINISFDNNDFRVVIIRNRLLSEIHKKMFETLWKESKV